MDNIAQDTPCSHAVSKAVAMIPTARKNTDDTLPHLNTTEGNTLNALARFAGKDGQIFASVSTLAQHVKLDSPSSMRRVLNGLRDKGYIYWDEREQELSGPMEARQTTNLYHFGKGLLLHARLIEVRQGIRKAESHAMYPQAAMDGLRRAEKLLYEKTLAELNQVTSMRKFQSHFNGKKGVLRKKQKQLQEQLYNLQDQVGIAMAAGHDCQPLTEERNQLQAKLDQAIAEEQALADKTPDQEPRARLRVVPNSPKVSLKKPDTPPNREKTHPIGPSSPREKQAPKSPPLPQKKADPRQFKKFHQVWNDLDGPPITLPERFLLRTLPISENQAIEAARKVLTSPYLRARYRSINWLQHIHRESYNDDRARHKICNLIEDIMGRDKKMTLDTAISYLPEKVVCDAPDTPNRRVMVPMTRKLLKPWVMQEIRRRLHPGPG